MVVAALLNEENLRDIAVAMATDLANAFLPGGATVTVLCRILAKAGAQALTELLRGKVGEAERQHCLDTLAGTPAKRACAIAEAVARERGLPPDLAATFVDYASTIPMTVRVAISRPSDGGTPNTLLSQLPRTQEDALRFMPLRPAHFRPGDQVAGHDYRVRRLIGQGGFAEVWKAEHMMQRSQPPVAIKFSLRRRTDGRPRDRNADLRPPAARPQRRPRRPAARHGLQRHAAVPRLRVCRWGRPSSVAGDFVGGPPSPCEVARILKMAARGLAEPHALGIVHRDLKPVEISSSPARGSSSSPTLASARSARSRLPKSSRSPGPRPAGCAARTASTTPTIGSAAAKGRTRASTSIRSVSSASSF